MTTERTYVIKIRMDADGTGGDQSIRMLQDLADKSAAAGVPLDELVQKLKDMGAADTGKAKEGLDDLGGSIDNISKRQARQVLFGLRDGINAIVSGNPEQALNGVASGLSSISSAIPSPVVAAMAGVAIVVVADAISYLVDSGKEKVNELGLTVDEEMARLESWANSDLEFDSLVKAFDGVEGKISQTQKMADTLKNTLDLIFKARQDNAYAGLEERAAGMEQSGDAEGAAAIREQIEGLKLLDETIKTLVTIEAKKASGEVQRSGLSEQLSKLEEIREKQRAAAAALEKAVELLNNAGLKGANLDPNSEEFKDLLKKTLYASTRNPETLAFNANASPSMDRAMTAADFIPGIEAAKELLSALQNYSDLKGQSEEMTASLNTDEEKYAKDASDLGAALVLLNGEVKALELQLKSYRDKLTPEAFGVAESRAAAQSDAIRAGVSSGTDPDQIAAEAQKRVETIDLATMSADEAFEKLKAIYAEMWALEAGADLGPALEQAQKFRQVIDAFGTAAQQQSISTPAEVGESIRQHWARMGETVKQGAETAAGDMDAGAARVAQAAGAVGQEVVKGGERFVQAATQVESTTSAGMQKFMTAAGSMATAAGIFSDTAERMIRLASSALAKAEAAERKAGLALQQIENGR